MVAANLVTRDRLLTGRQHHPVDEALRLDRAIWFAVKIFGFWLKVMAGRGAIPLTAVSYYFQFFEDPFLSSVVISGGTWLIGECVERYGAWRLNIHRGTASTALV